MNRKSIVVTLSALVVSGSGVALWLVWRQRKREQRAAQIMRELTKLLNPATTGLLAENAFDVNYKDTVLNTTGQKVLTLKNEVALAHANTLYEAWNPWWMGGDDEQALYGVFRMLQDKVQVSQIAEAYLKAFQVNLIDQMHEKLDEQEIKNILDLVNPLPAYRTI